MPQTLLFACDLSAENRAAFARAIRLAVENGAQLDVLHVLDPHLPHQALRDLGFLGAHLEEHLQQVRDRADAARQLRFLDRFRAVGIGQGTAAFLLVSMVAADAGTSQAGYGVGDTITFTFDRDTNKPAVSSVAEIDQLISERLAAKKERDFDTADRLQEQLRYLGVEMDDRERVWRYKYDGGRQY